MNATTKTIATEISREWRCTRCGKLLALLHGERLHIRFARGHEYLVGFPVTGVCRGCGTLNELRDATKAPATDGTGTT